ncbi:MAG: replication initiation factor domain-containing protein [Chloroflexi bacterium]|nr:replication initiation factor domain-containing protein [Chloroflexota bacterium]
MDWLAYTLPDTTRNEVVQFLTERLPGDFVELPRGRYGFEQQAVGPQGALVLRSKRRRDVHVSLPGKWCRSIDEPTMRFVLLYASLRGHVSRCDLAADDWSKRVTPADVYDAMERKEGATHCRDWSFYRNNKGGMTCTIGAASSLQQLKVYDKNVESRGNIDAIRWEIMARDEAAESLVALAYKRRWGKLWASRVVQMVDFRDRSVSAIPQRCPRLPWFASLVGDAKKARVYDPTPPRSLDDLDQWIEHQVGPSLTTKLIASGGDLTALHDYITDLAVRCKSRIRTKHKLMIAKAQGGDE